MILDLFAGPRGWSLGLHALGLTDVGIEWDDAACATAAAVGFRTIRADVAAYPTGPFRGKVVGLIASPPCTMFSSAGSRHGASAVEVFARGMADLMAGRDTREQVRAAAATAIRPGVRARVVKAERGARARGDRPRGLTALRVDVLERTTHAAFTAALVVEPARWVHDLRPEWVALEQVPEVLPLWRRLAELLRADGYSTWAGVLNAADYGVPQTRRRAVLMASRVRVIAGAPDPTHAERPVDQLFGPPLERWVSMAEALGWGADGFVRQQRGAGMLERHGQIDRGTNSKQAGWRKSSDVQMLPTVPVPDDRPAPTITSQTAGWKRGRVLHTNRGQDDDGNRQQVGLDRPAPTLTGKAGGQWKIGPPMFRGAGYGDSATIRDPATEPASTICAGAANGTAAAWVFDRPATTVMGDSRLWPPGHKINQADRDRLGADAAAERYGDRAGTESISLTEDEAAVLQTFPPGYPWQGSKAKRFEQIGNAVPPLLATHVVAAITGTPLL